MRGYDEWLMSGEPGNQPDPVEEYTDWLGAMDQRICPATAEAYLFTQYGGLLPDETRREIREFAAGPDYQGL